MLPVQKHVPLIPVFGTRGRKNQGNLANPGWTHNKKHTDSQTQRNTDNQIDHSENKI